MSQIYKALTSGPVPPDVPTVFVADVGSATPVANILNIGGRDSSVNNDSGIRTIADPNGGDDLFIELTNRVTGTTTTANAAPTSLVSISLGAFPGTFIVEGNLIGYNQTDAAGGAYTFVGAATTDGAVGTEIATETKNVFEQAGMAAADFNIGVTGNTAFVEVIGIAGKTISWNCLFTYRFVG